MKNPLRDALIEEAAKALFFRDMVDCIVPQEYYDIWEISTEPNASTGKDIQQIYRIKATAYLIKNVKEFSKIEG